MSAEAIIKSEARKVLKNNYVSAVMAFLIVLLPVYMINGATTAISCAILNFALDEKVLSILIFCIVYPLEFIAGYLLSPVINGYIRAYYKAAYTDKIELKDVFYYFSAEHYGKALRLNIQFIIRILLPAILLYFPLIIFENVSFCINTDFYGSVLYNNFYFIFAVLSTISVTLYSLRYFTLFTVSVDNPQFAPRQVFEYNRFIMQYRTGSAAKLIFSFTPWMLLGLLVLPLFYIIPYMTQSLCVSAKWMTKAALDVN